MKKKYLFAVLAFFGMSLTGCGDFLDQEPDKIMTDEQIFNDAVMIQSVMANYYGRVTWGEHVADWGAMAVIDDGARSDGGPDHRSTFENDIWRVYDYKLVRDLNLFLKGVRETKYWMQKSRLAWKVKLVSYVHGIISI